MLISTLTPTPGTQFTSITGQHVEIDQPFTSLPAGHFFEFKDCDFVVHSSNPTPGGTLFTSGGIRLDNCRVSINLTIYGQYRSANNKDGAPNIFITLCSGIPFLWSATTWNPSLQISGVADEIQVSDSNTQYAFSLNFNELRFSKLSVSGSFKRITLGNVDGEFIYFNEVEFKDVFLSQNTLKIPFVNFDIKTIKNIPNMTTGLIREQPWLISSMHIMLDILQRNKQGDLFLHLNNTICDYVSAISPNKPEVLIQYKIFRNFYSLKPWVILAGVTIVVFSVVFLIFGGLSPMDAFIDSLFAFSGNPNSDEPNSICKGLAAFEAYISLFILLALSAVLARKYVAHR